MDLEYLNNLLLQGAASLFGATILLALWRRALRPRVFHWWSKFGGQRHTIEKVTSVGTEWTKKFFFLGRIAYFIGVPLAASTILGAAVLFFITLPATLGSLIFAFGSFFVKIGTGFNPGLWWQALESSQRFAIACLVTLIVFAWSVAWLKLKSWHHVWRLSVSYPFVTSALTGVVVGAIWYTWNPNVAYLIWGATTIFIGCKVVLETTEELLNGHWGTDIIATLAIAGAIIQSEYLAGAIVALMTATGAALEDYGFKRATRTLQKLLSRAPKTAWRFDSVEAALEIPVSEVLVGDKLLIRPGDIVPVDCRILTGESEGDFSSVTGEPLPQVIVVGQEIPSGIINVSGVLTVEALRPAQESTYGQIVEQVKKAQEHKAPLIRLADKFSVFFTLTTGLMCLLAWVLTGDTSRILAVLVVATPCPLLIAAPIAVLSAMNRSAKLGILVKSGAALEQLAEVKKIFFDKTGTLTLGHPSLVQIITAPGESAKNSLAQAASLEAGSSHVLARALCAAYDGPNFPVTGLTEFTGLGVQAEITGQQFYVGGQRLIESLNLTLPDWVLSQPRPKMSGTLETFLIVDQQLRAVFRFSDSIRPEAILATRRLRALGLTSLEVLSGDATPVAEAAAREAELDSARGDLKPGDKSKIISVSTTEMPTAMVGDGLNDAPALAAATVGLAMSAHGTSISSEAADIVLLRENLLLLPAAIEIAREMKIIAFQSIGVGMGLSILAMVFAALGFIPPVVGAVLQEAIDVAVILNALRVHVGQA